MKNETEEAKTSKTKKNDVDDFKKDIVQMRSKTKERRVLSSLIILVVVLFATLGVGYYQIFVKPEQTDIKVPAEDKIESKPEIPDEKKEEQAPAQATPATPTPQPETTPPAQATPAVTEYTVQSGDTWSSIANANGMTSKQLMDYNGASNEDLQIGQKIKIPKS